MLRFWVSHTIFLKQVWALLINMVHDNHSMISVKCCWHISMRETGRKQRGVFMTLLQNCCKAKLLDEIWKHQWQQCEVQSTNMGITAVKVEAVGKGLFPDPLLNRQIIWSRITEDAVEERALVRDRKWSCLSTRFPYSLPFSLVTPQNFSLIPQGTWLWSRLFLFDWI